MARVPRPLARTGVTIRAIAENLREGSRLVADGRSLARWSVDTMRYRQLRVWDAGRDARRSIAVRGGLRLTYRLNRGDIRALAETWMARAYELPADVEIPRDGTIVDLGANIGLTALWLARRHTAAEVIAVEPSPANAELARMNLLGNGVRATVLEAAVGPVDGEASFVEDPESTGGRLAAAGRPVPMLSMPSVLSHLGDRRVDLLKLDIEGSEFGLLMDSPEWLDRVQHVVAELHPDAGDVEHLLAVLGRRGFRCRQLAGGAAYGPRGDEFMVCLDRPTP